MKVIHCPKGEDICRLFPSSGPETLDNVPGIIIYCRHGFAESDARIISIRENSAFRDRRGQEIAQPEIFALRPRLQRMAPESVNGYEAEKKRDVLLNYSSEHRRSRLTRTRCCAKIQAVDRAGLVQAGLLRPPSFVESLTYYDVISLENNKFSSIPQ
jgi:hypothetical protein